MECQNSTGSCTAFWYVKSAIKMMICLKKYTLIVNLLNNFANDLIEIANFSGISFYYY